MPSSKFLLGVTGSTDPINRRYQRLNERVRQALEGFGRAEKIGRLA